MLKKPLLICTLAILFAGIAVGVIAKTMSGTRITGEAFVKLQSGDSQLLRGMPVLLLESSCTDPTFRQLSDVVNSVYAMVSELANSEADEFGQFEATSVRLRELTGGISSSNLPRDTASALRGCVVSLKATDNLVDLGIYDREYSDYMNQGWSLRDELESAMSEFVNSHTVEVSTTNIDGRFRTEGRFSKPVVLYASYSSNLGRMIWIQEVSATKFGNHEVSLFNDTAAYVKGR